MTDLKIVRDVKLIVLASSTDGTAQGDQKHKHLHVHLSVVTGSLSAQSNVMMDQTMESVVSQAVQELIQNGYVLEHQPQIALQYVAMGLK